LLVARVWIDPSRVPKSPGFCTEEIRGKVPLLVAIVGRASMASNRPSRGPSNTGGKIEERSSRTNNKLSVEFLKNSEKKERGRDGLSRRASLVGNFHHLTKEPNGGSAGAPPATPRGAAASVPSTPRQASSNLDPVTPRGGRGRRHSAFGGGEGGGGGGGGGRTHRGAMSPSRSRSRGEKMSQVQKGSIAPRCPLMV
jgi:hypothetical protein